MKQMFGMRCCIDVVSVVAWTFAEYSRHDQLLPTLVLNSRCQLQGLYMERSQTVVDNACPLCCTSLLLHRSRFASKRSSSDKALIIHGGIRGQDVAHHVLEPVLVDGNEHHKHVWWRLRCYLCIIWPFDLKQIPQLLFAVLYRPLLHRCRGWRVSQAWP